MTKLGSIEYQYKDYELALLHDKSALDMSFKFTKQKDPTILINIAFCEWKLKRYQEALANCEEILHQYTDFARAYSLRGLINYDLGKKDKACADFLIVSKIKGTEESGKENLKTHGCSIN
ncbi:MAG: tetratricopeptide repeat protein [Bacteroidota bacterium]